MQQLQDLVWSLIMMLYVCSRHNDVVGYVVHSRNASMNLSDDMLVGADEIPNISPLYHQTPLCVTNVVSCLDSPQNVWLLSCPSVFRL